MLHIPSIFIAESEGRGRGIFTMDDIEVDDIIEVCPYVTVPKEQLQHLDKTIFYDYYFLLPDESGDACVALGYGSLYNHHPDPNAEVVFDLEKQYIEFHCIRKIEAGDEIVIDYQGGDETAPPLWFKAV